MAAAAKSTSATIWHNPSCSKSRQAKEILDGSDLDVEVVEYLKAPPVKAELERIVDLIDDPPAALVRRGDAKFKALGLTETDCPDDATKETVVALLVAHPELMERPVVIVGERAVIGRPTERVAGLLG